MTKEKRKWKWEKDNWKMRNYKEGMQEGYDGPTTWRHTCYKNLFQLDYTFVVLINELIKTKTAHLNKSHAVLPTSNTTIYTNNVSILPQELRIELGSHQVFLLWRWMDKRVSNRVKLYSFT